MHNAPAVSYPVGRSFFHAGLLASIGLAGLLAGLLWRHQSEPAAWRQGLFAILYLATGLAAFQGWRDSPRGSLQWDGQGWSLNLAATQARGRISAHIDLQYCLLLCLHAGNGRASWLWLERRREPGAWNALRRAVFSGLGADLAARANSDDPAARVRT